MAENYDFLGIGDIVTDAFIQLKDPSAHIDIDHEVREICMRFADKIPYENVTVIPAVGNSANATVAAARLGLSSALAANVGGDHYGSESVEALAKERVGTEFVRVHQGEKTNYHFVLWYDDDRTILLKHEAYPYELPNIGEPAWVYLSSLRANSLEFHQAIERYLVERPNIKLAFQPGTFQIKMTRELDGIYRRTDAFFCNKEEAQRITESSEEDIKKLMQMLHAKGPKIVSVSDGPKGAYASDGTNMWSMQTYPDPKPPYERTGAGDAFSGTFTAALALGKSVPEALRWGPVNSMSVVQQIGARAGLLTRSQLEEYLAKAPEDYKPKPIW